MADTTLSGDPTITPDQQVATGRPTGAKIEVPGGGGSLPSGLAESLRAPQQGLGMDASLLSMMMGTPMNNGQVYASALAGGVAQMQGRKNPVLEQFTAQQDQQRQQAETMYRLQENVRRQRAERDKSVYDISKSFMESPDRDMREHGAKGYFDYLENALGIRYTPEQQRSFITRGIKGDWLKDFYGDALSTNPDGQPLYSPKYLQDKYGMSPQEFEQWYTRRTDPNTLKQHGGYKTPDEMREDLLKRQNTRNDSFLKSHPEFHNRPDLFRKANERYRQAYGTDLLGTVDDGSKETRGRIAEVTQLAEDDLNREGLEKKEREARASALGHAEGVRQGEEQGLTPSPRQRARESAIGHAEGQSEAERRGLVLSPEERARATARGRKEGTADAGGGTGGGPSKATDNQIGKKSEATLNRIMSAPEQKAADRNTNWGSYDGGSSFDAAQVRQYYYDLGAYNAKLRNPLYKGQKLQRPERPPQVDLFEKDLDTKSQSRMGGIFSGNKNAIRQKQAIESLNKAVGEAEAPKAPPPAPGTATPGQTSRPTPSARPSTGGGRKQPGTQGSPLNRRIRVKGDTSGKTFGLQPGFPVPDGYEEVKAK